MSIFLEKEIIDKFIKAVEADQSLPKRFIESILQMHQQDKISKGTNLKKSLEDFVPFKEDSSDESKKN